MKQAMKQSKLAMLLNVGSIFILAVLVFLFAFYLIENKKLESLNDRRYQVTNAVQEFLNEANIMTRAIRAYAATGSAEDLAIFNEGKVAQKRFVAMEHLVETGLTPEEKGYADQIMGVVEALMPFEERAVALVASEESDAALDLVYGPEYMSNYDKFLELAHDLVTAIDTNATADVNKLTTINNVLSVLMVIALVAVVVIQFINMKLVNKKIIQPVVKVQQQMEELAKGNLKSEFNMEPDTSEIGMLVYAIIRLKNELNTYVGDISDKLRNMGDGNFDLDVNLEYIGDFAPIKTSIESIIYSLNETLSQINQASGQVAIGADQVSAAAQALSQGTTEQASSIEELSATISELADQIQQSSVAAQHADTATLEAKNELEVVNKHMFDMVQAMDEISASSSEISKIIKTIDDIAFQTNILALNAAVEAARAGSAGKGFAVVADEVRNLAGKSAEAAKTTTALIESSLQAVQAGSQTAQSTEDALKTVVEKAGVSATLISQIAENTENQARSAGQISLGISQISSVVQTNSATSEESAATSEELSGQAQMLKTLINKFSLKEQSGVGYYKSEPSYSTSAATIHQYEPADTSYDSSYGEPSYNSKSVNFAPAYKDSKY